MNIWNMLLAKLLFIIRGQLINFDYVYSALLNQNKIRLTLLQDMCKFIYVFLINVKISALRKYSVMSHQALSHQAKTKSESSKAVEYGSRIPKSDHGSNENV